MTKEYTNHWLNDKSIPITDYWSYTERNHNSHWLNNHCLYLKEARAGFKIHPFITHPILRGLPVPPNCPILPGVDVVWAGVGLLLFSIHSKPPSPPFTRPGCGRQECILTTGTSSVCVIKEYNNHVCVSAWMYVCVRVCVCVYKGEIWPLHLDTTSKSWTEFSRFHIIMWHFLVHKIFTLCISVRINISWAVPPHNTA